jgi:regulatory protein
MARQRSRKPRPPLNEEQLKELALTYVGRFATTRAKLAAFVSRKVRERGWAGERPADIEAVIGRMAELGYVDDAAYALSKSRSLTARGYGGRRVRQSLRAAGIAEEDAEAAHDHARAEAVEAALHFARRRRIGSYGDGCGDRQQHERELAAMIRAGHSITLAKAILAIEPGTNVSIEMLAEKA